jgi:hypothetical protein
MAGLHRNAGASQGISGMIASMAAMPPEWLPPEDDGQEKESRKSPVDQVWAKPRPLGYSAAMDSVGTVASPLLAGFALASVVVISDDARNFRWPGAGILALSVAAIFFLGALEATFNARRYIWSPADVADWWPKFTAVPEAAKKLRAEQIEAFARWTRWIAWARRMYNAGLLALLLGLSSAIPPPPGNETEAALRWVAASAVSAAFVVELIWMINGATVRSSGVRQPP